MMADDIIKMWRSPAAEFGVWKKNGSDLDDETITAEKTYSDDELKKISDAGFNAIWIHGQLHHFIKNSYFEEFAPNAQQHINAIQNLIMRAEKYNIKVYLYMQPPRAHDADDKDFWKKYSDVIGLTLDTRGDDNKPISVNTFCTSTQYVRDYIRDSFASLAKTFPALGGVIIISASEYPAHCYCRANIKNNTIPKRKIKMDFVPTACPRCGERYPEEVVVELLQTIRDGIRSVSDDLKIIFWNWSWSMYVDPPCAEIISKIPSDCILMADFERGGYRQDGTLINEYSLSYAGPSEQFYDSMQCAKKYGIDVFAKLQLGTTHELATVCSLPLINSIFRKVKFIRMNDIKGFMGCWNFGNQQSANTEAVNFFFTLPSEISEDEALERFAEYYFKGCDAKKIVNAWKSFADSMNNYPFNVPFIYYGVLNHSLGLLPPPGETSGKSVGRSWLPDERGDDYSASITEEYPLDRIIDCMTQTAEQWDNGLQMFESALSKADDENILLEYGNAVIIGCAWYATANLYKIYKLKLNWNEESQAEYDRLAEYHKSLIRKALPYVKQDSRQGYHIEGKFYSFNTEIMENLLKL